VRLAARGRGVGAADGESIGATRATVATAELTAGAAVASREEAVEGSTDVQTGRRKNTEDATPAVMSVAMSNLARRGNGCAPGRVPDDRSRCSVVLNQYAACGLIVLTVCPPPGWSFEVQDRSREVRIAIVEFYQRLAGSWPNLRCIEVIRGDGHSYLIVTGVELCPMTVPRYSCGCRFRLYSVDV
jgi:hypothetical protein